MNSAKQLKDMVDQAIVKYLEEIKEYCDKELFEAISYSIVNRGKRLRPVLMLLVGEAIGVEVEELMPLAISLEMIHSYSLVHDDLPSMDDDDMRSGMPTTHREYGEATAILAGDALLNLAYENMVNAALSNPYLLPAIKFIADTAGFNGMIGGQILDMKANQLDLNGLSVMYMKKTGALISAAVMAPIFYKQLSMDVFEAYDRFSTAVGLAFQLSDDVLDYKSGQDEDKTTFVTTIGLEDTQSILEGYKSDIKNSLKNIGFDNKELISYVEGILERLQ